MGMPLFYKGVAAGTFLGARDLRLIGVAPRNPGGATNLRALTAHICHGTKNSGFISLTRAYGVAERYALAGVVLPDASNPGHVYEIEIDAPSQTGLTLLDPVCEIAIANNNPWLQHSYHHNGDQKLLLGLIDPDSMNHHLTRPIPRPPDSGASGRGPNVTPEIEALVRALRDAEILAVGNIPASCVVTRYDIV